jgi:peptidoglycan L-alanyl-D-glutamate endopeptidase CwlK
LFDANGKRLGVVTKARGGQSIHNYGLALDIVLIKDTNSDGRVDTASWETNVDFDKDGKADWIEVVNILKANGWEWGGDWRSFKDKPHFEKRFGYTWKQLLNKYNTRDFIPGTEYINI